jgi:hypothetical protein
MVYNLFSFLYREYYFSYENFIKDIYLRLQMDINGFAPLALIAFFPRVRLLTLDMRVILEAVQESDKLDVKRFDNGYKVIINFFHIIRN